MWQPSTIIEDDLAKSIRAINTYNTMVIYISTNIIITPPAKAQRSALDLPLLHKERLRLGAPGGQVAFLYTWACERFQSGFLHVVMVMVIVMLMVMVMVMVMEIMDCAIVK